MGELTIGTAVFLFVSIAVLGPILTAIVATLIYHLTGEDAFALGLGDHDL